MSEPSRLVQVGFNSRQALTIARGLIGEIRFGLWTTSDEDALFEKGWLICDGSTIGNAVGVATWQADFFYDLFDFLWSRVGDAYLPILDAAGAASTRGTSSLEDFRAGKALYLPDMSGKSPFGKVVAGTGANMAEKGGTAAISIPGHYHGMGAGADLNIGSGGSHTTAIDHDHASTSTANADAAHSHNIPSRPDDATSTGSYYVDAQQTTQAEQTTSTASANATHSHTVDLPNFTGNSSSDGSHTHSAAAIAGRIGKVTAGYDGNTYFNAGTTPYFTGNFIIGF